MLPEEYIVKCDNAEKTSYISNKSIESVNIGKGIFTKEQIKEIAEYYLSK